MAAIEEIVARRVAALEAYVAEIVADTMHALGECYWTMRADNTFGQPSGKA